MPTPAQLLPSLGECAVSLCELAALISSGASTLSDDETRVVASLTTVLTGVARGEPLAPYWHLVAELAEQEPPGSYDVAEARARALRSL